MSPSLKYFDVLSIGGEKVLARAYVVDATCGEVTVGLGILFRCSDRVGSDDWYLTSYSRRVHADKLGPDCAVSETQGGKSPNSAPDARSALSAAASCLRP